MTQEEKQLLLKDLCARLPYRVKVQVLSVYGYTVQAPIDRYCSSNNKFDIDLRWQTLDEFKPYLRPMSSMTEEEENEYRAINCYEGLFPRNEDALDYVLSHHFDFRGLIPMGLALEASERTYKTE